MIDDGRTRRPITREELEALIEQVASTRATPSPSPQFDLAGALRMWSKIEFEKKAKEEKEQVSQPPTDYFWE